MDPLSFSTAMDQLKAEFGGLTTKDDVERAMERAPNEREPNALRAIVQTLRHLVEDEDYSTASDRGGLPGRPQEDRRPGADTESHGTCGVGLH